MSNLGTKLMTVQKNLPAYYGRGTLTTTYPLGNWNNVVFFPGTVNLFVAVNSYNFNNSTFSNVAAWSADGITWTQSTLPATDTWGGSNHGAAYAFDNKIVTIGWSSKNVAYTTDGKNWLAGTALPGTYGYSVGYANGVIVVTTTDASSNPSKTLYRATAVPGTWTTVTLPYYALVVSVANNKFFIYGFTNSTDAVPSALLTSTDGSTWTTQSMPIAAAGTTTINYRRVAYGNGRYVTIGTYQGSGGLRTPVAYSTDGVSWTASSFGLPNAYWDEIIFTGKYFLATNRGEGGSAGVYYSYDGNYWYPIYNTQPNGNVFLFDIAYGNGRFVAVTPYYTGGLTNSPVVGTA
jgi:hypothetical protein